MDQAGGRAAAVSARQRVRSAAAHSCERCFDDRPRVDPIVPVQVGDGPGLAEMLDAQGLHAMAMDSAHPGQGRGVAVQHGDNPRIAGEWCEQALDVRALVDAAMLLRRLRRLPAPA